MTDNINPTEPTPIDPELATDPRIAAFVEALRAPATATELAGEAAMVDLMLAAIAPPTVAKDRRTMTGTNRNKRPMPPVGRSVNTRR